MKTIRPVAVRDLIRLEKELRDLLAEKCRLSLKFKLQDLQDEVLRIMDEVDQKNREIIGKFSKSQAQEDILVEAFVSSGSEGTFVVNPQLEVYRDEIALYLESSVLVESPVFTYTEFAHLQTEKNYHIFRTFLSSRP